MGCCNNKNQGFSINPLYDKIKQSIVVGNLKQFMFLIATLKKSLKTKQYTVDDLVLVHAEYGELNLAGFVLTYGNANIFRYVHNSLKADLSIMEDYFVKQNISGLSVICEKNYVELFDYYAPLYTLLVKIRSVRSTRMVRDTFEFSERIDKIIKDIENECIYTPIQIACYYGNISIIKSAVAMTSKQEKIDRNIDVNYVNEISGENCALIACKTGNYNMIKFLHTSCNADFFVMNNSKENAVQVLAAQAKVNLLSEFYQCLVYLVEKVKVDVRYNYQETLLLIEYEKAADFFIDKLSQIGIIASKQEIDNENRLRRNKNTTTFDTTKDFVLVNMFPDLKNDSQSEKSCDFIEDISFEV